MRGGARQPGEPRGTRGEAPDGRGSPATGRKSPLAGEKPTASAKSRRHRVLGRHGCPAHVRRHHVSTETKNETCPHSCGRSGAALACRAACTESAHCRERGKSRGNRVLVRHGRPAQVRRHHLSTETKNATCPPSCVRSGAALACRARYVLRFFFLRGSLGRPLFPPPTSWAALCRPRSKEGRR